jgi:hypothetical protein
MSAPYLVLHPDKPGEVYIPIDSIEPRSGRASRAVLAELEMMKEDLTRVAKIAHALGVSDELVAPLMQIIQEATR